MVIWTITIIILLLTIVAVYLFRNGLYLIDKILIDKNKQIFALIAIIVIVFISLAAIEHIIINRTGETDSLFLLYGLFSQTIGVYPVRDNLWIQMFYLLVSILGTILFTGTFIATISNSFQRRTDDFKNGRARYSKLRNHDLIIGANEILPSVIIFLAKENINDKFVVITHNDINDVRQSISELDTRISKRVIIYIDDIFASEKYLTQLCVKRCRRTVILGDGLSGTNDVENVATLKRLHKHVKASGLKTIFRCFVSFFDEGLLLNYCCNDNYKDTRFRIYPFNFYAQWTDRIWGYGQLYNKMNRFASTSQSARNEFTPLKPKSDEKEYTLHIVVLGFSMIAMELIKTAVKVSHFANFNEQSRTSKTLITIITDDKAAINRFQMRYRKLTDIADVNCDYIDCNMNSIESIHILSRYAVSDYEKLYIAICSDNMNDNIILANNLPNEIYKYAIPTLVYQNRFTDAVDCLFNKHICSNANIKIFGAYNTYVDLCGSLNEAMVLRYINTQLTHGAGQIRPNFDEAERQWFSNHWDNSRMRWLSMVNAIYNIITSANFDFYIDAAHCENGYLSQFKECVEPVLQRQYIAWNIIAGYSPTDIAKDSEWLLKKTNTLHLLTEIKQHSENNDTLIRHIESLDKECECVYIWLLLNNIQLKKRNNV